MEKTHQPIRLWQGILAIILAALIILFFPPLSLLGGFGGTLIAEWLLVAACVLALLAGRVNPRQAFPLKKPGIVNSIGVVFMWVGVLLLEFAVICILALLFPEQFFSMGEGMSEMYVNAPLLLLFLAIAVTPAICEEVLFRGVFLQSLKPERRKWLAVLVSGIIFGIFHQDFIRIIPISFAGIMMGYVFVETGNMFYNCLFHFVNNSFSVFAVYLLGKMSSTAFGQMEELASAEMSSSMELPLFSVGIYVMMAAAAPACIYIGNYLMHHKTPGYRTKLFPSKKPGIILALIISTALLFFLGLSMTVCGFLSLPEWLEAIYSQM